MDQLICAPLSHTHYWYEVCMLKVLAVYYVYVLLIHVCVVISYFVQQQGIDQPVANLLVVSFCFVFIFMLSLKPRPFVQSFFDMQAPQ